MVYAPRKAGERPSRVGDDEPETVRLARPELRPTPRPERWGADGELGRLSEAARLDDQRRSGDEKPLGIVAEPMS